MLFLNKQSCICIAGAIALTQIPAPVQAGDKLLAVTPSGQPDMVFYDVEKSAAADKVANGCLDRGMNVIDQSDRQIVCEVKLGDLQSVFSQLLLGNSHSTPPRQFVKFNMTSIDHGTRVQASSWIETQMALGQVNRAPLDNDDHQNGMMAFMQKAGADYLPGTTFPNYAFLGALWSRVDQVTVGKKQTAALLINALVPGGIGERIGLQLGDQIVSINGEHFFRAAPYFKNDEERRKREAPYFQILNNQYLKMLSKANKEEALQITVFRNGQALTLEGVAAPRSAVEARPKSSLQENSDQ